MNTFISDDKSLLDIPAIHGFLSNRSYWAKGRTLDDVEKSVANSLCFGIYSESGKMLGFARVVTDQVVFAYLMDFFILEQWQGQGLGKKLARYMLNRPELQVRMKFLATESAHKFYETFGFSALDCPARFMMSKDNNKA